MRTYLGVDAGGSGSRWAVLSESGEWIADGSEGPAIQVSEIGLMAAAERITEILLGVVEACRPAEGTPAIIALAGADNPAIGSELAERLAASPFRVAVVGDTLAGAAAAFADGPGVALFAGTGSFAVARDEDGGLHRVGGRGPLISDHGSGAWLVRRGLEALSLREEGVDGDLTDAPFLADLLLPELGVASMAVVGPAVSRLSARQLAAGFPAMVEAASMGDPTAAHILDEGAAHLARLAMAVATRAGFEAGLGEGGVYGGGGTLRSPAYRARIEAQLTVLGAPADYLRDLPVLPHFAAALLARAWVEGTAPLCNWLPSDGVHG